MDGYEQKADEGASTPGGAYSPPNLSSLHAEPYSENVCGVIPATALQRIDGVSKILYTSTMQTIIFAGTSRDDIRAFPVAVRREVGRQLLRIQYGLDPVDWKPMKTVGVGVREVRIHIAGEYRVFYVANIGNVIYVLHAFQKKTQKTATGDIALARWRYKQIGDGNE